MIKYALYLERGIYVKQNYELAYRYFVYAGSKQSGEGLYHLGRWYFFGIDHKEDKSLALDYFKHASLYDFPEASFMVGYMYHYGDGVKQDLALAKEYYLKAIKEGSKEAQKELNKLEVEK